MSKKNHIIKLSDEEYIQLRQHVRNKGQSARAINRARILLLADEQMSDEEIAETLGADTSTVYRIRRNYHQGGLALALQEKPRSGAPCKIDGRLEATLTMLACSDPPGGYGRWTLQLLADKLVELEIVDAISLATVRTALKKTSSNLG